MRLHRLAEYVVVATLLGGCATAPVQYEWPPATKWRTTLVTASGSAKPGEIQGVSQRFTFDGRIFAHATLVAEGPVEASTSTFTMKWFNGSRMVHERSATHIISKSPYYLVHAVPGSVLGTGGCRVELHSSIGMLASQAFSVRER